MIPRYEQREIASLWKDESRFQTYLEVELALLRALEEEGTIPEGVTAHIERKARVVVARIREIEGQTFHDMIAFCSAVTEGIEDSVSKYFHYGVTSSDIIDTAQTLMVKRSLDCILPRFREFLASILAKAQAFKGVITMGRSHGMWAEPTSFGIKLLGHYAEGCRRLRELEDFYAGELTAQFSGAVGNYTVLTPSVEERAARRLGLRVEPCSTQVVPRDRLAKLVGIHALAATGLERLAVELRHLHRSEVGEVQEGFRGGQKGSSTMPHKKNPIATENITGIARVLRSHQSMALENVVLWHERDISHSSAERLYLPDNLGLFHYALGRFRETVDRLVFCTETMEKKVKDSGVYLSSYYLHKLIQETDCSREKLYGFVQEAAFKAQRKGPVGFHGALVATLKAHGHTLTLPMPSYEEIKAIYLSSVDAVFRRAGETYGMDPTGVSSPEG